MKKLIVTLLIIFLSTTLVHSRGNSEETIFAEAEALLEEKKVDEAIKLLTDYIIENPNAIYDIEPFIEKVRKSKIESNEKMTEIYDILEKKEELTDEDFAKAEALIEEFQGLNPFPDPIMKTQIRDAKRVSSIVNSQNNYRRLMNEAELLVQGGDYYGALEIYKQCFDFQEEEFDLLLEEDLSGVEEVVDLTSIEDEVPLEVYYNSIKRESYRFVDEIKRNNEDISDLMQRLLSSYDIAMGLLTSDVVDLDSLERTLLPFKEVYGYIRDYERSLRRLDNLNNTFSKVSTDGSKSNYISFASFTLTGRWLDRENEIYKEEGVLYVLNRIFPVFVDDMLHTIEERAITDFNNGVKNYNLRASLNADNDFDSAVNNFIALVEVTSLWKSYIEVGLDYELSNTEIIEDYYSYIGDARRAIEIIEHYRELDELIIAVENSFETDNDLTYRTLLEEEIVVVRERLETWGRINDEIEGREQIRYNMAGDWTNDLITEYTRQNIRLVNREIDLLNRISSESYITIFDEDIILGEPEIDILGNSIDIAASATTVEEIIYVYFGIENTDERELETFNPEVALSELNEIEVDYLIFIDLLEDYLESFRDEKDYILEDLYFGGRVNNVQTILNSARAKQLQLITYKQQAQTKIRNSKGFEDRGVTQLENAILASQQQNFNGARDFIKTGKELAEQAISFNKNRYVIDELIPEFYNLEDFITQEEARLVIQEVRRLITVGKTQYLEGAYLPASNIFREAELKWAETNTESHPEIPYWLALIKDALDIESGRYLNITEPLYSVLAGYLSFAENFYRLGVRAENRVEKIKAFSKAKNYLNKVIEVKPLNERARFLQLQVQKSEDPEAFKVTFNNEFQRYRNITLKAIDDNENISSTNALGVLASYEEIVRDAYLLNPRLSGTIRRAKLERFYKPVSTSGKSQAQVNAEKSANEDNRTKINESYIRFKDLFRIAEGDQKNQVSRMIDISEVALGFRRLPVDISNIRESNAIFARAQVTLSQTNQTEIEALNDILSNLQRAVTLNPGNENIPVVIDEILYMLGEESNFQLSPEDDKLFREAQKLFIDALYFDAESKIIDILNANSKNKNYPKLKELIQRVEIKLGREIAL